MANNKETFLGAGLLVIGALGLAFLLSRLFAFAEKVAFAVMGLILSGCLGLAIFLIGAFLFNVLKEVSHLVHHFYLQEKRRPQPQPQPPPLPPSLDPPKKRRGTNNMVVVKGMERRSIRLAEQKIHR